VPIFASLADKNIQGLVPIADALFLSRRAQMIILAARYAVPVISWFRDYAQSGGLLAYGPTPAEYFHLAGTYAGRVLRGTTPADLPVIQPTLFELTVNLRTAKAIGITVPPSMLAVADEVIE
jgi:putative tryptophan/tyrosine transport system substrate-binding protein